MAPAIARAIGPLDAAAPVTTAGGAEVVEFGGRGGELVVVTGGGVCMEVTGTGMLVYLVDPGVVTVTSAGRVMSTKVGTLVARVIGTKTVAFVVGGSRVFVMV